MFDKLCGYATPEGRQRGKGRKKERTESERDTEREREIVKDSKSEGGDRKKEIGRANTLARLQFWQNETLIRIILSVPQCKRERERERENERGGVGVKKKK